MWIERLARLVRTPAQVVELAEQVIFLLPRQERHLIQRRQVRRQSGRDARLPHLEVLGLRQWREDLLLDAGFRLDRLR